MVVAIAVITLTLSSSADAMATGAPASPPATGDVDTPVPSTHPIQHVVVIYLENEGVQAVNRYGMYERYLGATYGNATWFYSACHGSMSNYIAAVAAVTNYCGSDAYHNYTNTSLADLIQGDRAQAFTWAQFAENLPTNICSVPDQNTAMFVFRHTPLLLFANDTRNETYCQSHILGSSFFNGTSGSVGITSPDFANFSFYTPNLCDDGHNDCVTSVPARCASVHGSKTTCEEVAQADIWLQNFLGSLLNSTDPVVENNVNHTMFIVTWDEDGSPTTYQGYSVPGIVAGNNYQYCLKNGKPPGTAVCGGHVYALVIDHYNRGVAPMSRKDAAYGIAATVDWLFDLQGRNGTGLGNVGEYDYLYRNTSPGFPAFSSLSGITWDGYSPGF